MFRSLRWRVGAPTMAVLLVATAVLVTYISSVVRRESLEGLESQLTGNARMVALVVEPLLAAGDGIGEIQPVVNELAAAVDARVTVIRGDGLVLGDSLQDPALMENHLQRPEVQAVLKQGVGVSTRYSQTAGYDMMYAATPILGDGGLLGVARVALPLALVEDRIGRLRNTAAGVSVGLALLAGLLLLLSLEGVIRPLQRLTDLAETMSRGDLAGRIRVGHKDEVGKLADAFNRMAQELDHQLAALADQHNALTAMLSHMADGVIITGPNERVELVNPSAARVLEIAPEAAVGERFVTVVRDHQVVEVWRRCRATGEEQAETVDLVGQRPFLQVVVTPLAGSGCLILLQDLTRIRRLETVRRDFITNISHELRTPLASLHALVETLQDGALDDRPAARRFLELMDTEVDALTQMVEELLELSRIESGRVPVRLVPTRLVDVVTPVVERLESQARRAKLALTVDLPQHLPMVLVDPERVGRVITNLVHNAIKFTPRRGSITISGEQRKDEVVVWVKDTGVGIAAADLPRIFERFFKADQARSSGGTGLGLAIARHLVQAHGGRIWAESVEGEGSTFFFSVPSVKQTLT